VRSTQPLIQWSSRVLFPKIKRPERECGHSSPCSTEFNNRCSSSSLPPTYRQPYLYLTALLTVTVSYRCTDGRNVQARKVIIRRWSLLLVLLTDTRFRLPSCAIVFCSLLSLSLTSNVRHLVSVWNVTGEIALFFNLEIPTSAILCCI